MREDLLESPSTHKRLARRQARRQGSILDATEHSLRLDALDAGSTLILDTPRRRLDKLDSSMPGLWFDRVTGCGSELGHDVTTAVELKHGNTTIRVCHLLEEEAKLRVEWQGALVLPICGHDETWAAPDSPPSVMAAAVARGCGGEHLLRRDLLPTGGRYLEPSR